MTASPLVTIVIPARNEAADIAACLEHVAAQHYPHDRIEVLVVDGSSTDGTPAVVHEVLSRSGFAGVHVIDNPAGTTPSNLNVGLQHARGELVCRVDARTLIEPHHVRTCVDVLTSRPEVAVVGGAQRAVGRDGQARSVGIARALNNRYSMGGSPYRRSVASRESDTVYLGAFRRSDLVAVGGWDERLATNQDFDLNRRLSQRGLVWFDGSLRSGYLPRMSLRDLWRQYVRFGRAKVAYWALSGDRPQRRQVVLLGAPVVGSVLLGASARRGHLEVAVALGAAALVAVDHVGSDDRRARGRARLVSVATIPVVAGGWLVGAWTALLRVVLGRRPSRA
jgi:glycosyltransferase involved in cell wall biosynthesis